MFLRYSFILYRLAPGPPSKPQDDAPPGFSDPSPASPAALFPLCLALAEAERFPSTWFGRSDGKYAKFIQIWSSKTVMFSIQKLRLTCKHPDCHVLGTGSSAGRTSRSRTGTLTPSAVDATVLHSS